MNKITLHLPVAMLLLCTFLSAGRVYISNSGSSTSPYDTPANATSNPVDAFNALSAGTRDTVVFNETGTYNISVPCTIDVANAVIMPANQSLQCTVFTANAATDTQHMIWVVDVDGITIRDIYLNGNNKAISGIGHGGVDVYNWTIDGCEFFNIRPDEDTQAWTAATIIFGQNTFNGHLINNCYFHDIEGRAIMFKSIDNGNHRNEIARCVFHDVSGTAIDIWDGNETARLYVHHNLCYNSASFFNTDIGVRDTVVYNTAVNNSGVGFNMTGRASIDSFNVYKYNIAWGNVGGDFVHGSGPVDGYYFETNCYNELESGITAGPGDVYTYPAFTDTTGAGGRDFTLTDMSNCINASGDVTAQLDMDSTAGPVGPFNDLGCYEYPVQDSSGWWNGNWRRRRKLLFINGFISADQDSVPVYIKLFPGRIDYSKCRTGGADLRFVDDDNSTELKYEIETWNEGDTSHIWVRVPRVEDSGMRDSIWMYFDNPLAADNQDADGVWNSDYLGVWHVNESGTGDRTDASGGGYDFSTSGYDGDEDGTGIAGNADSVDGSDDYLVTADFSVMDNATALTVEAWVRSFNNNQDGDILARHGHGVNAALLLWRDEAAARNNTIALMFGTGAAEVRVTGADGALDDNDWHYVAGTFVGATGTARLYIDGAEDANSPAVNASVSALEDNAYGLTAGRGGDGGDPQFTGFIDEVRVSKVTHSALYVELQDSSIRDNLIEWGAEQTKNVGYSWWHDNWTSRRVLNIDNGFVGTRQDSFTALVKLWDQRINYSSTQGAGQDLRFIDADGISQLDYEIEQWDESGTSYVWVRLADIKTGGTADSIFMYYGNSSVSDDQDADNTWNGDYIGVWHFTASDTFQDVSGYDNHAVITAGPSLVDSAGITGGPARYFKKTATESTNVVVADDASLDLLSGEMTITAVVKKVNTLADWNLIATRYTGAGNEDVWFLGYAYAADDSLVFACSTSTPQKLQAMTDATTGDDGIWRHFTGTYDGSDIALYQDGALVRSTGLTGNIIPSDKPMYIGGGVNSGVFKEHADIIIDELRISKKAGSALFAEAQDSSVRDNLFDFGSEETGSFFIDSVHYYCAGTGDAADDSMIVWFNMNLEFDSLPLAAGLADSIFGMPNYGDLSNATIDTPEGCPDTNFIFILMNAGDTMAAHYRSNLALVDSVVWSTGGSPAAADTDTVVTFNVWNITDGEWFEKINDALNDADMDNGDTIQIFDAGYYEENIGGNNYNLFGWGNRRPQIRYSAPGMDGSWRGGNLMVWLDNGCYWHGIDINGLSVDEGDTAPGNMAYATIDTWRACRFYNSKGTAFYFNATTVLDSCEMFDNGWDGIYYRGNGGSITNCLIHDNGSGCDFYNGANFVFKNNKVYNNNSRGIFHRNTNNVKYINNLIYNNPGQAWVQYTGTEIGYNNKYLFNTVYGNGGELDLDSNAVVVGNIVLGNTGLQIDLVTGATLNPDSCRYNWTDTTGSGIGAGFGHASNVVDGSDPEFRDAAGGDFRLKGSSGCINYSNWDSDSATAYNMSPDIVGTVRPSPDGFNIDLGCYEDVGLLLDSAVYRSAGTPATGDDTLYLYFDGTVEYDSLPTSAGGADSLVAVLGGGGVSNATVTTPNGSDNDTVLVLLSDTDTILCHLRSRVVLVDSGVWNTNGSPAVADTDSVRTWNVGILRTPGTSYATITSGIAAAAAGDSVLVLDAGYYIEKLDMNVDNLTLVGYGIGDSLPVLTNPDKGDTMLKISNPCTVATIKLYSRDTCAQVIPSSASDPDYLLKRCDFDGGHVSYNLALGPNGYTGDMVIDSCSMHSFRGQAVYLYGTAGSGTYLISNNLFYDLENTSGVTNFSAGIFIYNAQNVTVRNNTFYNVKARNGNIYGGAVFWRAGGNSNVRIIGNFMYGCDKGISQYPLLGEPATSGGTYMAFNTIVNCEFAGIDNGCDPADPDTVLYNICWGNNGNDLDTMSGGSRPVADYNVYQTLGAWVAGSNSDNLNPQFVDSADTNCRLQPSSPYTHWTDIDAAAAAVLGVTTDMDANTRPSPIGSFADPGAYEEQTTSDTLSVDSAVYWSCGTRATDDDTVIIWFNTNLEFDSIPLGTGGADSAFAIAGLGGLSYATLDTPEGCPDTNFIIMRLAANDTIFCHNRTRLVLLDSVLYTVVSGAALADTDTVVTWNVHHAGGNSYMTLNDAYTAAGAGDSILVWDAGQYPETLNIRQNTALVGYGIEYGEFDSLPVMFDDGGITTTSLCSVNAPCTLVGMKFSSNTAGISCIGIGDTIAGMDQYLLRCWLEGNDVAGYGLLSQTYVKGDVTMDSCIVTDFTVNAAWFRRYFTVAQIKITNCLWDMKGNNSEFLRFQDCYLGDTLSGNIFRNCGYIRITQCDSMVITDNEFYNGSGVNGIIWTQYDNLKFDISRNVFRDIFDNGGAIQISDYLEHSRITTNLFLNCDKAIGRNNADSTGSNLIAFNTIVQCTTGGIALMSKVAEPDTYMYNIVWSNTGYDLQALAGGVPVADYNVHSEGGLVNWPAETHGDSAYPQFRDTLMAAGLDGEYGTDDDGFALLSTSPFIQYSDYSGSITDITGRTRPDPSGTNADLGAYENPVYTGSMWWDTDWSRRSLLRFDNGFIGTTQETVTCLVKLWDERVDYNFTRDSGQDIRFIDADGWSVLDHEIEQWDEGGTSYVWVQVHDIKDNGTADSLWMYYGNPGAPDGQDGYGTWDGNYMAVWHLHDTTAAGSLFDATIHGNHGSNGGSRDTTGWIGKSQHFSIADRDSIFVPFDSSLNTGTKLTIEFMGRINRPDTSSFIRALSRKNPWNAAGGYEVEYRPSENRLTLIAGGSNYARSQTGADPLAPDFNATDWYYITGVADSTWGRVYVDAVNVTNDSSITQLASTTNGLVIGGYYPPGGSTWDGFLDEMRISNIARSALFVEVQDSSMRDNLFDFGVIQAFGPEIDSAVYRCAGTVATGDDTLYLFMNKTLDYDSIPTGAGDADLALAVLGRGSLNDARLTTPDGGDNDTLLVVLSNTDTIFSHNRVRVALLEHVLYDITDAPSMPDTNVVLTYNVYDRTLDAAYQTIKDAYDNDGDAGTLDTIMIFDDGWYDDTLRIGQKTVITTASGMTPAIRYDGSGTVSGGYMVSFQGVGDTVILDGLDINGQTVDSTDTVSTMLHAGGNGATHIIRNCVLHVTKGHGLFLESGNFLVEDCEIYDIGSKGFQNWYDNDADVAVIRGNRIHDVAGDAIETYQVSNHVFENNIIYDNGGDAFYFRTGGSNILRGNVIANNAGYGVLQYTSIVGNLQKFNRYENNTIFSNGYGLMMDSLCRVVNNVIYDNAGYDIRRATGVVNAEIRRDSITYNLLDSTGSAIPESLTGEGMIYWGADPLFIDTVAYDFHLRVHSPAIDAGDTAAAYDDYDGGRNDMGAYGGQYAVDTLMPHALDSLAALGLPAVDSLRWYGDMNHSGSADHLTSFLVVYRDSSGYDFAIAESLCIDTVYDTTLTGTSYTHNDKDWYYKVGLVCDTGYAGGFVTDSVTVQDTVPPVVDSAVYYSYGTATVTDDSLFIYFSEPVAFDSLPTSDGGADTAFDILGKGTVDNAQIKQGPDDSTIVVYNFDAGDTIFSHNRTRLTIIDSMVWDEYENPCESDTDSVITYNVYNERSDSSYTRIDSALAHKPAASLDSILVFDYGLYADTLHIVTKAVIKAIFPRGPTIAYPGYGIDLSSYEGWAERILVEVDADSVTLINFKFDGGNGKADSADVCVWFSNDHNEVYNCEIFNSENRLIMGAGSPNRIVVDSCLLYQAPYTGIWSYSDNGGTIFRDNVIRDMDGDAIWLYSANNNTVEKNVISGCRWGVRIRDSHGDSIRDNLIQQCTDDGIYMYVFGGEAIYDIRIINNTIFSCGNDGISINDSATNLVMNNISYQNAGQDIDATGAGLPADSIRYNCFGTAAGDVDVSHSGNITAYPAFVDTTDPDGADGIFRTSDDGFVLQVSSPCVDATGSTGAGTDIAGTARPLPVGSSWDMGCYEEQVAVVMAVDSIHYWAAGTESVADDSMIVWFSGNLEFDSLPDQGHGAGLASGIFTLTGLGHIGNATVDTPVGCPDTNFIIIQMNAGDTILCHDRSILALVDSSVYSAWDLPVAADTDSVVTYNVYLPRTGDAYTTLNGANTDMTDGDSMLIFDAGLYAETLAVDDQIKIIGYGIDYPGTDSLPVLYDPGNLTDGWRYLLRPTDIRCSTFTVKFVSRTDSVMAVNLPAGATNRRIHFGKCVFTGSGVARTCIERDWWKSTLSMDSCEVYGYTQMGIYLRHDDFAASTGQVFTNNTFHDIGNIGVWMRDSREMVFSGNTFYDVHGSSGALRITACFTIEVTGNTFYSCTGTDAGYAAIQFDNSCYNYTVSGNVVYDCDNAGGGINFGQSRNGKVYNNLVYNCDYGLTFGRNDSTYSNLVMFNTVVQCTSGGLRTRTRIGLPDTIQYNIAWSNGGYDLYNAGGTPVADYNWYSPGGLLGWTAGANTDSGYPVFADTGGNDWSLQMGSPCLNFTDVDAAAAAAFGMGTDLAGNSRPLPAGSNADPGCYEESVALPVRIDSVKYWAVGTESFADDSLIVWFSANLEFDSLPLGAGDGDLAFAVAGPGCIVNATIDTPDGCPDTNFIYLYMNAGDTILSHLRSRLALVGGSIYSDVAAPALADTDSVATWNVYNLRTDSGYTTIELALLASVDNDTVMVFDQGYYTDTLNFCRLGTARTGVSAFLIGATGMYPVIKNDGTGQTGHPGWQGLDMMIYNDNENVEIRGICFDGINFAQDDTCSVFMWGDRGTVKSCSLYYARCKFDDGAAPTFENNNVYGTGLDWWTDNGGSITGNEFLDCVSLGADNVIYLYDAQNAVVSGNRILHSTTGSVIHLRNARDNVIRNNIVCSNTGYACRSTNEMCSRNAYRNNTFINNGYGLEVDSASAVRDNIFFGNTGYNISLRATATTNKDSITYNYFDTTGAGMGDSLTGAGNVISTAYPLFSDTAGGDFHLRINSPCIDRGDTAAAVTDYDGSRCDMGSYGGPYAIDTLMPRVLDYLVVRSVAADSDMVAWVDTSTATDFWAYLVYRDTVPDFIPAESLCIDTVTVQGDSLQRYGIGGIQNYYYKVSVASDTMYGGGYVDGGHIGNLDTFYVNPDTGTNTLFSGTFERPAQTLYYTNNTLLLDSLIKPVVIRLEPGQYRANEGWGGPVRIYHDPITTSAVNTLTIEAYDKTDMPIIGVADTSNVQYVMDCRSSYATYDHIKFALASIQSGNGGVRTYSDHVTWRNCWFFVDTAFSNEQGRSLSLEGADSCTIQNCVFYSGGYHSIVVTGGSVNKNIGLRIINNVSVHRLDQAASGRLVTVLADTITNWEVKNNIVHHRDDGVVGSSVRQNLQFEYNIFYDMDNVMASFAVDSATNTTVDPLFKDVSYGNGAPGDINVYLRKYSPAIDGGDPNMLDLDSSRADMGAYGGQYADTLAPRRLDGLVLKRTFGAVNRDTLWFTYNNPPNDTMLLGIYRGTTDNFTPTASNIVDSVSASDAYWTLANGGNTYHYKVNCWDTDTLGGGYRIFDTTGTSVESLIYHANGTGAVDNDSLWVIFDGDIKDPFAGNVLATDYFTLYGEGSIAACSLNTGHNADDDSVLIFGFSGFTSILDHNRSRLKIDDTGDWLDFNGNAATTIGSTLVATYNVYNSTDDASFVTIQAAYDGMSAGDTVHVLDEGWYTDSLTIMKDGVYFVADTGRTPVIRWDNTSTMTGFGGNDLILSSSDGMEMSWDGFEFYGINIAGTDTAEDLIFISEGRLRNCIVHGCKDYLIYVHSQTYTVVIETCSIYDADNGLYYRTKGADSRFQDNEVYDIRNDALFLYGCQDHIVQRNLFHDNVTALNTRAATGMLLRNNLVYENTSALVSYGSELSDHNKYLNNTFFSNTNGLELDSLPLFRNNIIWGTGSANEGLYKDGNATVHADSLMYNCVDSATTSDFSGSWSGTNIDAYPLFSDTVTGDFHLRVHSPCIDRGDTAFAYLDLDSSRNDMGAYGDSTAYDTAMPPKLDTLIIKAGAAAQTDSLIWTASGIDDFNFYAIYRDTVEDFVPTQALCIDSIPAFGTDRMQVSNSGKFYYYKVSVVDDTSYGGGYVYASYGKMEMEKRAAPTGNEPGDTITYTIYYDNDGRVGINDTAAIIDYVPEFTMFLDTAGKTLHSGGDMVVSYLVTGGTWKATQPSDLDSVKAVRWKISPDIGAQSNTGDPASWDLNGTGIDTNAGDDAGWVRFRVRIR